VGLRRQFKIFDTNGNQTLEFAEFKKAIEDFDIILHPKDVENLFKTFDMNGDGHI
jgi:Ca2+-binding EF-hand superfamily protein